MSPWGVVLAAGNGGAGRERAYRSSARASCSNRARASPPSFESPPPAAPGAGWAVPGGEWLDRWGSSPAPADMGGWQGASLSTPQKGGHTQPPHPGVGIPLGFHQGVELLQAPRLAGRLVQPVLQALAHVRQGGEILHCHGTQLAQHRPLQPLQRGWALPLGPQLLPQGQGGLGQPAGQIRSLAEQFPGPGWRRG